MSDTYSCPLRMTQQFKFCSNPFRIDMYKGCDFGCKYCFSNLNASAKFQGFAEAKISQLERYFKKAFDEDSETSDITTELMRHKVPFHCGGMSDPFQTREWELELTYKLIQLSVKYNYPILFSTKTASLPDKYFDILNPEIHAFHLSICGWSDKFIHKWESNTPTAKERLDFVKLLRDKGFWCGLRIQPIIDIEEAEQLVINAKNIPNYITVEHIKLPNDNVIMSRRIYEAMPQKDVIQSDTIFRNLEIHPTVKRKNIYRLKKLANENGVLLGVGDNDLHFLSQSRCCCGMDLINENFSNYLKYNMTYMSTGSADTENFSDLWIPCQNCKTTFNSKTYKDRKFVKFKDVVDEYIAKHDNMLPDNYRKNIEKQIFGSVSNRLI